MIWSQIVSFLNSPGPIALATALTVAGGIFTICKFFFSLLSKSKKTTWRGAGKILLILVMLLIGALSAWLLSHVAVSLLQVLLISNGWVLIHLPEFFNSRRKSRFLSFEILGQLLFMFFSANVASYVLITLAGYHGSAILPVFIIGVGLEFLFWSQDVQYKQILPDKQMIRDMEAEGGLRQKNRKQR